MVAGNSKGNKLLRIEAPHFVADVVLNDQWRAIHAAPIVRYMVGWNIATIYSYCEKKEWELWVFKKGNEHVFAF